LLCGKGAWSNKGRTRKKRKEATALGGSSPPWVGERALPRIRKSLHLFSKERELYLTRKIKNEKDLSNSKESSPYGKGGSTDGCDHINKSEGGKKGKGKKKKVMPVGKGKGEFLGKKKRCTPHTLIIKKGEKGKGGNLLMV